MPILSVAFLMMGADFKPKKDLIEVIPHCSGYTIVEAGVGVDCYGDTVKLVRRAGFYELERKMILVK